MVAVRNIENLEILPITEKHIESFHACLDSVAKERIHLARLEAPSLEATIEFVKKKIAKEIVHFVAILENTVIGWCDIHPLAREGFTHCGILGMGVLKDYRGKGIGKVLLNTAIAKAEEKGLERIELDVYSANKTAVYLYKKLGFEAEGIKKKARKIDGEYYDILCMALLF